MFLPCDISHQSEHRYLPFIHVSVLCCVVDLNESGSCYVRMTLLILLVVFLCVSVQEDTAEAEKEGGGEDLILLCD